MSFKNFSGDLGKEGDWSSSYDPENTLKLSSLHDRCFIDRSWVQFEVSMDLQNITGVVLDVAQT